MNRRQRGTIVDHLASFGRHARARVFYLNLATRRVPWYVTRLRWDLIVFHTVLLSQRWGEVAWYERLLQKARPLASLPGRKVILPQDEFIATDALAAFVR